MPAPVVANVSQTVAKRAWKLAAGDAKSFHHQYDRESYQIDDPGAGERGMALGFLIYRKWVVFSGTDIGIQLVGMDRHAANRRGAARQDRFRKLLTHTFECLVRWSSFKPYVYDDVKRVAIARGMLPESFVLYAGFVHGMMSEEYRSIVQEAVTAEWEFDEAERLAALPPPPLPNKGVVASQEAWWFTPAPAPASAPSKRRVSNVVEIDSESDDDAKRPRVGAAPPKIASGEAAAARAAAADPPVHKQRDERRKFPMFIPAVRRCSARGPPAWKLEQRERAKQSDAPPPYEEDHEILCSSGDWRQIQAPTELASHLGVYFYNVRTLERFWKLPPQAEQLYQDPVPQPVPHTALEIERSLRPPAPSGIINERVILESGKHGTVRYVGEIGTFKGDWFGVELDEPVGNCDGATVGGVYHFRCAKNHGIYIRPARLAALRPPMFAVPEPAHAAAEVEAAVNRAAAKVDELDARVRAELAAEKEAENNADLAPMTDDDEPMPTGGPPAESAPVAPTPTPVPTPVPTPKVTRSWQVPRASRSLVALQEKMNGNPTTHNVISYLFVKAKLLAGASMLEYDSMGRALLESTSPHWYIVVKTRGRKPEDTNGRKSTKWDAYVMARTRGAAQRLREWQPKSYCNGSLRSEVQIKRFFEDNPDFNETLPIPA